MLTKLLESSRFLVLIAVLGAFFGAVIVLVFGAIDLVRIVLLIVDTNPMQAEAGKVVAVAMTELIDLFLLGTVLYIIAIGLYELFIDPNIQTPAWLHIDSLDDLKEKLIGVTVVLLAVAFLGQVVEWKSGMDIFALGGSIALVTATLVALLIANQRYEIEKERLKQGIRKSESNSPADKG